MKGHCHRCGKEVELHGRNRNVVRVKMDTLLCQEDYSRLYALLDDFFSRGFASDSEAKSRKEKKE